MDTQKRLGGLFGGLLALALVAQEAAPQEVLQKTPPPQATEGIVSYGAGGYRLPNGERLVPARDPLTSAVSAPASSAVTNVSPAGPPKKITVDGATQVAEQAIPRNGVFGMRAPTSSIPLNVNDSAAGEYQAMVGDLNRQKEEFLAEVRKAKDGTRKDDLDVDPEGALIMAQIDPKTGKPRRRASEIAASSGLVMIPAGTMLYVRNYTRVQTELGGTCIGVLEYDVLDAQMRNVAIPKGSRILGAIQTVQAEEQSRAAIIFRQIVDPNGDQVQLMVTEGVTNSIGMAGIGSPDGAIINRRLGAKFGYALAWGLVSGLTGQSAQSPYSPGASFGDLIRTNVASQFGQVGQNALQQAMNIKSTIEIPENISMRVILGNPIYIRPWRVIRPY